LLSLCFAVCRFVWAVAFGCFFFEVFASDEFDFDCDGDSSTKCGSYGCCPTEKSEAEQAE
jgi:hypothetical protein